MKKTYILKLIFLLALSFASFSASLYLLYQLYISGNDLAAPLTLCIAVFALCQLLIHRCELATESSTNTENHFEEPLLPVQETSEDIPAESSTEVSEAFSEDTSIESSSNEPSNNLQLFSYQQPLVEMDIISAARDAMESLTSFAEAQNIKLHLSTTNDTLMIMAEPESIRILFRNIIDNSIKYMGRAGHMIITISLLGDDIFIILKDTGKGLSEDETTHVFELNFQGSNRVSGNGLGLTQTKMIVEAFGGTIYAKSSPENGMAIYIQLPVSGKRKDY